MPMDCDVRSRDAYLVKSVVHSSRLFTAFRSPGEALRLREIASRSGLPKTMVFRLLYTLEKCGMVEKVGENLYQSCLRPWKQKLYRLGYAASGRHLLRREQLRGWSDCRALPRQMGKGKLVLGTGRDHLA